MKNAIVLGMFLLAGGVLSWAYGKTSAGIPPPANLVPNGDLERGKEVPLGWEEPDDLTTFWERRPEGGHCFRFDTDVYMHEVKARRAQMKLPRDQRPPAKPKTPTSGPRYNTAAGVSGVWLYSDYLEVEPGATYRLRVEVMSRGPEVKIFVKGYALRHGERRVVWRTYKTYKQPDGRWRMVERTFTIPRRAGSPVRWIRLQPYAFWPPGEVFFDNFGVVKVTGAEN
ncbi:MAG TPA: hypothetical protein EYP85_15265 [Armatimonadetes bacterium]|nr:hypothetical protein [Armatimonadota bacterium]